MKCPLDYSMCCQTVTIYRKTKSGITRRICNRAFYQWKSGLMTTPWEEIPHRDFQLIVPGNLDIQEGDRIYPGIGPKQVDWDIFVPAAIPCLSQVGSVIQHRWFHDICHTEARR